MKMSFIRALAWILLLALGLVAFSACDSGDDVKENDTTERVEESSTEALQEASTEAVSKGETEKESETEIVTKKPHWSDDGVFKLLCFGNSFSIDSLEYLYPILQEQGIQ